MTPGLVMSTTNRGKPMVIYRGFRYRIDKPKKNALPSALKRHRCNMVKGCTGKLHLEHGEVVFESSHSHDADPAEAEAKDAYSKMKAMVRQLKEVSVKAVMDGAYEQLSDDVQARLPRKSTVQRTLQNQKGDILKNPNSRDFEIPEEFADFILFDTGADDAERIIVFGLTRLLRRLGTDIVYGDGTFDKCPDIFFQIYTLHGKIGESYPPLVYFLLPGKTSAIYERMLIITKDLLFEDFGIILNPKSFMVDFEVAMRKAIEKVFPEATVKGCFFHLTQSLTRKVASLGLKSRYSEDIDTRLLIRSLSALAFVPEEDVQELFAVLALTFPDEEVFKELLRYFERNYVGHLMDAPRFSIRSWNHFDSVEAGNPRTSNCCEAYHSSLNSVFHASHPSIWKLLERLRKDAHGHRATLNLADNGNPEPRRAKVVRADEMLARTVETYKDCASDKEKLEYLRRIGNR